MSSPRRFAANTPIAWTSAFSNRLRCTSRSIAGRSSRSALSWIASQSWSASGDLRSRWKTCPTADCQSRSGISSLSSQNFLVFAAVDRQRLMRADGFHPGLEIVIYLVDPAGVFRVRNFFGAQDARSERPFSGDPAHVGVVADGFRDDIPGPGKCVINRGDLFRQIRSGDLLEIAVNHGLFEDQLCQPFQAFFAGDAGPGPPFGFVWLVQVFQSRAGFGCQDFLPELWRKLSLFLDRGENRRPAFVHRPQVFQRGDDFADLLFVQPAGDFFTIAGDKREGIPPVQQLDHSGCLARGDGQVRGDGLGVIGHELPVLVRSIQDGGQFQQADVDAFSYWRRLQREASG